MTFPCKICKKKFSLKVNLQHHLKIHASESLKDHPDGKKCTYCSKFFLKKDLKEHVEQKHQPRKCEDCGKVYFHECSFDYHKKTHEEPKFTCDICGQKSSTKLVLQRHMQTIHLKNVGQSKCEICNKMIMTYKMKLHIQQTHERKLNFKCDICKKGFRIARDLKDHLALKHLEKEIYKCSICDISVSSSGHLKRHIDSIHEKKVVGKCEQCSKIFTNRDTFRSHLKKHEKIEYFTCDLCKRSFSEKGNLRRHMKIHLNELAKAHPDSRKCKHCSQFILKENWREHYRKYHKPQKCEVCGKYFYNRDSFYHHKKMHKGITFTCDLCGKETSHKSTLESHMQFVHLKNVPRSKCEICDKMIFTREMKNHIQNVHEKKFAHICIVCNQGFSTKVTLQSHLALKHLEQELNKCSICDKNFASQYSLNHHIKVVHEKVIVAKCEKCGRPFTRLKLYRNHLKMHEKKPFSCNFDSCFNSYQSETDLKKHLLEAHVETSKKRGKDCVDELKI